MVIIHTISTKRDEGTMNSSDARALDLPKKNSKDPRVISKKYPSLFRSSADGAKSGEGYVVENDGFPQISREIHEESFVLSRSDVPEEMLKPTRRRTNNDDQTPEMSIANIVKEKQERVEENEKPKGRCGCSIQ